MRITPKVEAILNKQINAEFWSAYFYLSIAAYFEKKGLRGFANWMRVQYQEETSHALNECYEGAGAERDHDTSNMLKWFIDEQAEEEQNVLAILDQLNLMGENGHAVFFMDKELATRVFVDATKAPAV